MPQIYSYLQDHAQVNGASAVLNERPCYCYIKKNIYKDEVNTSLAYTVPHLTKKIFAIIPPKIPVFWELTEIDLKIRTEFYNNSKRGEKLLQIAVI